MAVPPALVEVFMPQLTHADYLALRRFPALDGLRAVAAVMVVFQHFGGKTWAYSGGWMGVDLFFVLSGFLITTLALREEGRKGRASVRNFYLRRVFRLMPVYYVVLAATALLYYWRGDWVTAELDKVLPYYLTFNNEFIAAGHIFGHSWTLAVEQKFYLVWPLLAFAAGFMPMGRRLGIAFGAIALLALVLMVPSFNYGTSSYIVILMGCVVAILLHDPKGFAFLRGLTRPWLGFVFLPVLVAVQLNAHRLMMLTGSDTTPVLIYGLVVCLLLLSVLGDGPLVKFFSTPPMKFVGERSYSLYLVQGIAASFMVSTFPPFRIDRTFTAIMITLAAIGLADLLFRHVEQPMIEVGRKLIARLDRRTAEKRTPQAEEPPVAEPAPVPVPNPA
ncbi:acyltransferase [Lentzea sp. NPDC051838]|uniref:acyltransferase family protein n=1 Tax=Lentzea sp. NPDC051838 TaxID=3154849 RepID=UPI003442A5E1